MGKGTIIENKGDGLYKITVDFQRKRSDERVKQIDAMIAKLQDDLSNEDDDLKKSALKAQIVSLKKEKEKNLQIRSVVLEVWCTDLTSDLSGEVSTAEIPGELKAINIRPGFFDKAIFNIEVNGQLQPPISSTPAGTYLNQTLLPWWQKFKPIYRHGIATNIDKENHTCLVTLESAKSVWQNFDVNQTGAIANVPIKYMDCDSYAFDEGDPVLVQFIDQNWLTPQVVGFKDHPKPCYRKIRVKVIYDFDNSIIPLPDSFGSNKEFDFSVSWKLPNGEIRSISADSDNIVQAGDFWEMTLTEAFDGSPVADNVWITVYRQSISASKQKYFSVPAVQYPFNYKNGTFKQEKDLVSIDNEYEMHLPYWRWKGFAFTSDHVGQPVIYGDPTGEWGSDFWQRWKRDYPTGTIWPDVPEPAFGVENQASGYVIRYLIQTPTNLKWLLGTTIPYKSQFIIQDLSWGYHVCSTDPDDGIGGYFMAPYINEYHVGFPDLEGIKVEVEEADFALNVSFNPGELLNTTTDWKPGSDIGSEQENLDNPPTIKVTPLYIEGRVENQNGNAFADVLISSDFDGISSDNVRESLSAGAFWDENQAMLDLINAERAKI